MKTATEYLADIAAALASDSDWHLSQFREHFQSILESHAQSAIAFRIKEEECERLKAKLAEEKRRTFQDGRISYRGFGYGIATEDGRNYLRAAIRSNGHD